MKNKLITKKDLLFLAALLFAALLGFIIFSGLREKGNLLIVTLDGKEILREYLTEEKEIRVETGDGGYNVIKVIENEDGTFGIRCEESNCPEKICIGKGLVTLTDDPIVCLPHRMTAKLTKK